MKITKKLEKFMQEDDVFCITYELMQDKFKLAKTEKTLLEAMLPASLKRNGFDPVEGSLSFNCKLAVEFLTEKITVSRTKKAAILIAAFDRLEEINNTSPVEVVKVSSYVNSISGSTDLELINNLSAEINLFNSK